MTGTDMISAGLRTGQKLLERSIQNDVRANDEGFVKRTAHALSEVYSTDTGGVTTSKVRRAEEPVVFAHLKQSKSDLEQTRQNNDIMKAMEGAIGKVGKEAGTLSRRTGDFIELMRVPQMTSNHAAYLHTLVTKASTLAAGFRDIAAEIQNQRTEADKGIGRALSEVNKLLQDYSIANKDLMHAVEGTEYFFEARDRRDMALLALSSYMRVQETQISSSPNGCYLHGPNGIPLVTLKGANQFSFQTSGHLTADASLENHQLSGVILMFDDLRLDVTHDLKNGGGSCAAFLEARDHWLPDWQSTLDSAAGLLADKVNAVYSQGTCHGGATHLESSRILDPAMSWENLKEGVLRVAVLNEHGDVVDKRDMVMNMCNNLTHFQAHVSQLEGVSVSWTAEGRLSIDVAAATNGARRGLALCSVGSKQPQQIIAALGLNDLFWGLDHHQKFSGTVPKGFASKIAMNPEIAKNNWTFSHALLSDTDRLNSGEKGTQASDCRGLQAMARLMDQVWTYPAAGAFTEKQRLTPEEWGRSFDTFVAQRHAEARVIFSGQEGVVERAQEAYDQKVGIDPFKSRQEQIQLTNYLEHMNTLLLIQQSLDRDLSDTIRRVST